MEFGMPNDTDTPYAQGWHAACEGKLRHPGFANAYSGYDHEWLQGYDDQKAGQIDARAYLGRAFAESKKSP